MTVFVLMTGEWSDAMAPAAAVHGGKVTGYFIPVSIIGLFLILNRNKRLRLEPNCMPGSLPDSRTAFFGHLACNRAVSFYSSSPLLFFAPHTNRRLVFRPRQSSLECFSMPSRRRTRPRSPPMTTQTAARRRWQIPLVAPPPETRRPAPSPPPHLRLTTGSTRGTSNGQTTTPYSCEFHRSPTLDSCVLERLPRLSACLA